MRNWKKVATRVASRLERRIDTAAAGLRARDGLVEIHPFRGYGTATTLHVLGRVLRQPRIELAADHGTPWSNLIESFRRMGSEEVAEAKISAQLDQLKIEAKTDDEGYFHVEMAAVTAATLHRVELRAIEPPSRNPVVAEVLVPPPAAEFGIISDIDDTIVETNATGLIKMARTVFMQNARGRLVAPGVADFYRSLQGSGNPFFYVSSSPWNFYDLLDHFLALNRIPIGPLMLQDYGIDDTKLIHSAHDDHKLQQIEEIFETYPLLPFVLVGDSGQRDPEIYREVTKRFPTRVREIYIRDVTTAARDAQVRAIADELTAAGFKIQLVTDWRDLAHPPAR